VNPKPNLWEQLIQLINVQGMIKKVTYAELTRDRKVFYFMSLSTVIIQRWWSLNGKWLQSTDGITMTGLHHSTQRNICPSTTLSITKPTWAGMRLNLGLHGERPPAICLSHHMDILRLKRIFHLNYIRKVRCCDREVLTCYYVLTRCTYNYCLCNSCL